ncbi:hypothetical protein EGW08_002567 [Elysia chlorotica]|uniref:Protein phosphatase 1 regulatory subunit 21 n=1 Tax=Elysia chlorotica TaxID=188477 RepID=A0A3S1CDD5_ELYCH|nr:hypothetical protein EGW08_002567 [Elysia chlorotica]
MADLQEKYQKLAGEYAKLKAQIPVLKKAYLDEQGESNKLKESLKEKSQTVRKYEQEVDSLTFRNQQLSKRVVFLQEELEATETSSKKKNKAQLKAAEESKGQHEEVIHASQQRAKEQIDKLQEEKAMLEVHILFFCAPKRRVSQGAEQNLNEVEKNLHSRLVVATKTIQDKLPFIDTKIKEVNGYNLPTHDRRHQLRAKELITQGTNLVGELVQGLSNFFTYTEQRSKIYPADGVTEPISPLNINFCKHLHENMIYLRPVEQSLRQFANNLHDDSLTILETASELQDFAKHFNHMVVYMNKLLPYYISSLEAENAVSSCTATLESKNKDLLQSLKRLNDVFNKMDTYVSILATQSSQGVNHPRTSHPKFFTGLSKSIDDLHTAVKEVSKHYNSKVSLEHQLPTATKELKRTDECVVASLISLVTNTGKMAAFLSGNLDFFTTPAGYRTRGGSASADDGGNVSRSHPVVNTFRQRAAQYLSSISKPIPESVPHCIAVQNRKTLYSSAESKEGLAKQLSMFQQKLTKLEQEKEHYILELQLLKIKFENEQGKTKQLERDLEKASVTSSSGVSSVEAANSLEDHIEKLPAPSDSSRRSDSVNSGHYIDTSMLGQLETSSVTKNDHDTREQLIMAHYSSRINDITLKLQQADSKTVNFHAEVRALQKQLKIAEKEKDIGQDELKLSNQSLAHLKDELQTTSRSYEGQLSMMSEHLAGMNEKLAEQKDEIDELKQQLTLRAAASSKSSKKSKK